MCRYAFKNYKPHLACFRCRKSFKSRLLREVVHPAARPGAGGDVDPTSMAPEAWARLARCPDCGGETADMGLDFAPPPRRRVKEWAQLEELYALDITFRSCGCSGPGYRPRARSEMVAFLRSIVAEYEVSLDHWSRKAPTQPREVEERRAALASWGAQLAAARAALSEHGG